MPTPKKAIKKTKKKADPITWKKGLVKHKKTLAKTDAAIPIRPKWGKKRIVAILNGLMSAHYFFHSGALQAYLQTNPFMEKTMDEAKKAISDARTVFYQAQEAFTYDEWDDDDVVDDDDDDFDDTWDEEDKE